MDLTDAKIELEVHSLLRPCEVCSRELKRFEKLYNAKLKVYSTEHTGIGDFYNNFSNLK